MLLLFIDLLDLIKKGILEGERCLYNVFLIVYIADILLGLKVTETGNAGAYLSGLIVLIGNPLHPELENPTRSLISVLRGTDKSLFAHN